MDPVSVPNAADEQRIAQHRVELAAGEASAAAHAAAAMPSLWRPDAAGVQFGADRIHRAERQVALEDALHQRGFFRHRHKAAPLGAVADRNDPAHPHALGLGGGDLVADALGGDLALELGEGEQHVQRQPAHRRGGVEGLGDRDEADPGGIEGRHDPGEVGERPGQAVDLVDDHRIDLAGLDVGEQPGEGRALQRAAGIAAVIVAVRERAPALVLLAENVGGAGLALGIERVEVLLEPFLGRLARVDRTARRLWIVRRPVSRRSRRISVAQAEEGRTVARTAGDRAGDGGQRFPAMAAPEITGLGDLHLVALALPDPDEPGAWHQPSDGGAGRRGTIDRAAAEVASFERSKPPLQRLG